MPSSAKPKRPAAKKAAPRGLYANIHAKQERIAQGSGETMREPGSPGAPTEEAFEKAAAGKDAAAKRPTAKRAPAKAAAKKAARKRP
jgi:hypothetical protein